MPIVPIRPIAIDPPARSRRSVSMTPASPASLKADPHPVPLTADVTEATKSYAVGYGKPPSHSRFKPGQSGNPKGRPKGAKSFNTIIRENLLRRVGVRTPAGTKKVTHIEALVMKTIESGTKGDLRAIGKLVSWFELAMPRERASEDDRLGESPSATDDAMLAELRGMLLADHHARQDGEDVR